MNSRPRLALLSRWLLGLACLALATIGTPAAAQPYGPPRFDQPALDSMLALYSWHGRHHVAHVTELRQREGW